MLNLSFTNTIFEGVFGGVSDASNVQLKNGKSSNSFALSLEIVSSKLSVSIGGITCVSCTVGSYEASNVGNS